MILRGLGADAPILYDQTVLLPSAPDAPAAPKPPAKKWNENPLVMGGIAVLALGLGYWTGRK